MTGGTFRNDFDLLVFDWDGTLVDSIGRIVGCVQRTLSEIGLPAVDETRIRMSIGLGIREMVNRFLPGCDDELFARIREVYGRHWREHYSLAPALFPGARAALAELADAGYLLAVATAKGRWGLDSDLEATGLATSFHATRTADEALAKPSPAMLLEILDELGVRARAALMVGDTVHDLQMAVNAGVAGVGVTCGSHSRAELERVPALAYLDGVGAMPRWLQGRRAAGAGR